jgi:hypothetical protein
VATTTVTEALAELKVIDKRIATKRTFITSHLSRPEQLKDPLAKDGGSAVVLERELQSIRDLCEQRVAIRRAIQAANARTEISVGGKTRTIADWLEWRRRIADGERDFLRQLVQTVERARQEATRKGGALVSANASMGDSKPSDIVVNMSEVALSNEYESLQAVLETLDGQLSLKNATVTIEY